MENKAGGKRREQERLGFKEREKEIRKGEQP